MEVDYTTYTVEELLDVQRNINPNVAPENFRRLNEELEKRKDEINEKLEEKEQEYTKSVFSKVKAIGYLQLIGGGVFFLFSLMALISEFSLLSLLLSLAASALSIFAGWHLLKSTQLGYTLTYINQFFQLPVFYSSFLVYDYSALGGIFLGVSNGELGLTASFDPGILVLYGQIKTPGILSIDLLAVAILVLIGRKQEFEEKIDNKNIQTPPHAST